MAATSHSHSCSGRHAKIHSAPPRYQKAPKMQGAPDNAALQRSPKYHPSVVSFARNPNSLTANLRRPLIACHCAQLFDCILKF